MTKELTKELGRIGQEIIMGVKPGTEVGIVTNIPHGLANVDRRSIFNADGTPNAKGVAFMKENLNICKTGSESYPVDGLMKPIVVRAELRKGHVSDFNCYDMSEENSLMLSRKLEKTGIMTEPEYNALMNDLDPQFRKIQETCLDSKKVSVGLWDIANEKSKWKMLCSFAGINIEDNSNNFYDSLVFKTVKEDVEFCFEYTSTREANPILTFMKKWNAGEGVDAKAGRVIVENQGITILEQLSEIERFANVELKDTINAANQKAEKEELEEISVELKSGFYGLLDDIKEETGVSFDVLADNYLTQNSMFKVQELMNNVFNVPKLKTNIRGLMEKAIANEIRNLYRFAEFTCKRESGIEVEVERDVEIKDVISFAFESLTAKSFTRGGIGALNKMYSKEGDFDMRSYRNGALNVNPMCGSVKRTSKVSVKAESRAFSILYNVVGNALALNISDEEGRLTPIFIDEESAEKWLEAGFDLETLANNYNKVTKVDGGYMVENLPVEESKIKIVALDAVRNVDGVEWFSQKIDNTSLVPEKGSEAEEVDEELFGGTTKELSEELKKRVLNSREKLAKLKELKGDNEDILDLVGLKVWNNKAKNCMDKDLRINKSGDLIVRKYLDKNNTPRRSNFDVYAETKDGKVFYVGNSGRTEVDGTIVAAIGNVLLVEEN